MELKNRINQFESRLIQVSQRLQTVSNKSSYNENINNSYYTYQLSLVNADYQNAITLAGQASDSNGQTAAMYQAQLAYSNNKAVLEAMKQSWSDTKKSETDAEAQALEAEQDQLQTQVKAARAEYDSLGEAMDNDISKGAIKLV
jgi:hypothetical protein